MLTMEMIRQAQERLRGVARVTPLNGAKTLGRNVYMKAENLQLTGAFKLRGAYSKLSTLTEEERDLLRRAADKLRDLAMVPCTACRYCEEGCPQDIHIPDLIRCLNHRKVYGKSGDLKERYQQFAAQGAPASACIGCGQCEGVCPQHLPVPEILRETAEAFEG